MEEVYTNESSQKPILQGLTTKKIRSPCDGAAKELIKDLHSRSANLGISRQAVHHCLKEYQRSWSPLSIPQILAWADGYHARMGKWPKASTRRIPGVTGLSWRSIDNALRFGFRGLPGGSSLAQELTIYRGVRNVHNLSRLTKKLILFWADEHYSRTGNWPTENSGEIAAAPGEIWRNVDMALREGNRCPQP